MYYLNVIYILWLRQLKRYVRSRSRLIASVGQPLLFLIAFGFGFGPVFQRAGAGNYLDFLAPGIITMTILFTAMFGGIEVIWDKQFGFLKETLVAPVPRWVIMLGRTLGGATSAIIQGLIVFVITLLVGYRPEIGIGLIEALFMMLLIATLFTALGTALASRLDDMQAFPLIMNFIMMPLFFLSGALFPTQGLPPAMLTVIRFDPLSYGVDGMRSALGALSQNGYVFDATLIGVIAFISIALGAYLFEKIEA